MKDFKYHNLNKLKVFMNSHVPSISGSENINKNLWIIYSSNLLHYIEDSNKKITFLDQEYLEQPEFENVITMVPLKRP